MRSPLGFRVLGWMGFGFRVEGSKGVGWMGLGFRHWPKLVDWWYDSNLKLGLRLNV